MFLASPSVLLLSAARHGSRLRRSLSSAASASPLRKVGVIGLGLMGHGIAQTAAAASFNVVAVDNDDASVGRGLAMIKKSLEGSAAKAVSKGSLKAEDAAKHVADVLSRVRGSTSRRDLADCDLIVEAVPETMAIKTPLYKELASILRPDAIVASNTSGLPVQAMADIIGRQSTMVGRSRHRMDDGGRLFTPIADV